ncbi:MAG: fibronectin type III domain-containing protein [Oscillospiraceae bacterium]|nr:fibronectin type III domain-containing protein [Oscillospiraceae bacterium]
MKNTKHQLRGIKRIISAAMAAAVTATALSVPMTAFAEQYDIVDDTDGVFTRAEAELSGNVSKEWNGTIADSYDGGTGTEEDPYLIATGEQLALLAYKVNHGNAYKDNYFKLTADILLNDTIDDYSTEWTPIGKNYNPFGGYFDGDNHKVIGMYIYDGSTDNIGLFGFINNSYTTIQHREEVTVIKAEVKNVGVTDGYIKAGGENVGGICGLSSKGKIINCYSAITIDSSTVDCNYGGVCGNNNGILDNCYNKGTLNITGGTDSVKKENIGGVCGLSSGPIKNCYNIGSVLATVYNQYVGGVCGKGIVRNCHNEGTVNGYQSVGGVCGSGSVFDCYNSGKVTGVYWNVGGVCGESGTYYESGYGIPNDVTGCYNLGLVTGGTNGHSGGICGYIKSATITNCYNKGKVNGQYYFTGGICGKIEGSSSISRCYNTGAVSSSGYTTGGIAGYIEKNSDATIKNCYNTGTVSGVEWSGGIWGWSDSSDSTMANCINIGITSDKFGDHYPVGNTTGKLSGLYYDSDVIKESDTTEIDNSDFARTTVQLTSAKAIDDLGLDPSIWDKKTNTNTYWFYPDLKAFDDDGAFYISGEKPKPTNLKAIPGDSKVTLTWDAVEGATNYAVFLRKGSTWLKIGSSGTNTTFTSRGLENGGKYFYMVKAYVNGAWSGESDAAWAIPLCITPQNVKASAGDGKVTLTWDAVKGASNYAVFLRKGTAWLKIGSSGAGTTFTSRGLANGGKYFYMVKAYVNGSWSDESAVVSATPVCITPQNVKAVGGAGQATITWDAVTGATNYAVMMKKGTSWLTLGSTGAKTSYTAKGLASGGKYYFVVKSFVNGAWGDMSETVAASIS